MVTKQNLGQPTTTSTNLSMATEADVDVISHIIHATMLHVYIIGLYGLTWQLALDTLPMYSC